ncbi:hypothetical protein [Streptomyces scabiei]|uniref:hypothetical protein n=1 Tax=Streptomyces scabiei TaxID=1930 RepID=UPI0029A60403|nr:hypothetical protein [Streptomyces scabiei]MDX3523086.1 hypothetical protein [Streptomyces scabiei]
MNEYNRNTDANPLTLLKRFTVVPVNCDDGAPTSYKGEAVSGVRTWYDDRDTHGTPQYVTKATYTSATGGPVIGMKVEDPLGNTTASTSSTRTSTMIWRSGGPLVTVTSSRHLEPGTRYDRR